MKNWFKALILGVIIFSIHDVFGLTHTVEVTASGSGDYTFAGDFHGEDTTVFIDVGDTLVFNVNAPGHPFWLKTVQGDGTGDAIAVANNGTTSETIVWAPMEAGNFFYNCELHSAMTGTIVVSSITKMSYAWVKNNTPSDMTIIVERTVISSPDSSSNFFCWGNCYPAWVSISTDLVTIASGDTDKWNFIGDYAIHGGDALSDTAEVRYCFIDSCDATNTQCFSAFYSLSSPKDSTYPMIVFNTTCLPSALQENANHISKPSITLHPNPVKEVLNLEYSLDPRDKEGCFILRNVLGAEVRRVNLHGVAGKIRIPVSGLNRGVYFYSLVVGHSVYSTKKLIIDN